LPGAVQSREHGLARRPIMKGCSTVHRVSILRPCCPGQRLRLNRRARRSPAFCFVGSSSRFPKSQET
jgi:hypothetical protein